VNGASRFVKRGRRLGVGAALSLSIAAIAPPAASSPLPPLLAGAEGFADRGLGGIRGITIGPIENSRHSDKGYGTEASGRSMVEARTLGANWVSLTPFGRTWDLAPTGIDLTFETPFEDNRANVLRAIRQAHREGLKVFLVPHLWVETGGWRALIDPGDDAAWARWTDAYRSFLLTWAEVAAAGDVEMLSIGVELRSWVTTPRAASMLAIIADVRGVYPGLLTYSANWDDVGDTAILGALDLIGINAFYPLAEHDGASPAELAEGGRKVAASIEALSRSAGKPVVLTEIGYTTRANPAVKPWEWPDGMKDVKVDERAQAEAYRALIAPFLDARWCAGFFVWRFYADPDDVSQEAEWGFSPRGKQAELVMRDAFTARWATDPIGPIGDMLGRSRARTPGVFGWTLAPEIRFAP
jgi:hypothetical protein